MAGISSTYLIKLVKEGKAEGLKITKNAWHSFKKYFDVVEKNGGLIIVDRIKDEANSIDTIDEKDIHSLYTKLGQIDKSKFTFDKYIKTDLE